MNRKIITLFVLIMVTAAVMISACSPARRPGPAEPEQDMQTPRMEQANPETAKARQIAERVDRDIQEINSASVVISGNQAWIGEDAAANMQVTDQVKDRISALVKEMDQSVDTVYVTADADTVTRIRNIADDIAAGKPISGFINELNEIAGRITPTPR